MSDAEVTPPDRRDDVHRLAEAIRGEVHTGEVYRRLYATDASIYARMPLGVVCPRGEDDVAAVLAFCRRTATPLIPRAAGTSLAGQVVGGGLVVDLGRHMNRLLDIDVAARQVRVQPGVIQDDLNRALRPHGLFFAPDTSTASRAMIGGMMGNNSCGSRSILYGTTRDHVLGATVELSDGHRLELGALSAAQVDEAIRRGDRLGGLIAGLRAIVTPHRERIQRIYPGPEVVRRNTGYALDYLARTVLVDGTGEPLNLARFLCGSEGTLAVVTQARLNAVPLPGASGVMVSQFESLEAALEASVDIVALDPSAVELVDKAILDLTVDHLEQRHNRFFIRGDPSAILIVEFTRDSPEAVAAAKAELSARMAQRAYATVDIGEGDVGRVWSLRKAGLGLLMGVKGDAKGLAFVEDTAVAVERLPAYIARFRAIMERHQTSCVYYGHASVGELHLRPVLNPKRPEDLSKLERIAGEVAELVVEFGGSLSGEHGDGRVRSPYLERMLGGEIVEALKEVKALWDPDHLLNPGKIVDPEPLLADLRTSPGDDPDVPTVLSFEADRGLMRHVEQCNGAGVCRKLAGAGGTMCPSYMATRDELHTTRGRANVFREMLRTRHPEEAMAAPELYQAMELCLSCKGCKSECPASVDVAKLKAEFLQHYWDMHGTPLGVKLIGHIDRLDRLALMTPGLANWAMENRVVGSWIRRLMGIDPSVPLPPVAPVSLRRWLKRRARSPEVVESAQTVALFVDEFTDAHDVEVGRAAVELLEALGYRVVLPRHGPSGRALISKGLLRAAAVHARANVEALHPLAAEGIPILGMEPSAALTLVDEVPDLVPAEMRPRASEVAARVRLVEDFLVEEAQRRPLADRFDAVERRIWVHGHCHQKALVGVAGTRAALEIPAGHQVRIIDAGCCGMAGSFGYEHRQLSLDIAELRLFPALRALDADALVAAPGFSCRHQVTSGLGRVALHPVQILRQALRV